jgi:hypothetical protein
MASTTGIVLVLVAHNGKTLQLDCGAQTRCGAGVGRGRGRGSLSRRAPGPPGARAPARGAHWAPAWSHVAAGRAGAAHRPRVAPQHSPLRAPQGGRRTARARLLHRRSRRGADPDVPRRPAGPGEAAVGVQAARGAHAARAARRAAQLLRRRGRAAPAHLQAAARRSPAAAAGPRTRRGRGTAPRAVRRPGALTPRARRARVKKPYAALLTPPCSARRAPKTDGPARGGGPPGVPLPQGVPPAGRAAAARGADPTASCAGCEGVAAGGGVRNGAFENAPPRRGSTRCHPSPTPKQAPRPPHAGAQAPPLTLLPPTPPPRANPRAVPQLAPVPMRHPLEAAHSPLVRALPEYERQFEQQLVEARAYWETSQQRMHWCAPRRWGCAGPLL